DGVRRGSANPLIALSFIGPAETRGVIAVVKIRGARCKRRGAENTPHVVHVRAAAAFADRPGVGGAVGNRRDAVAVIVVERTAAVAEGHAVQRGLLDIPAKNATDGVIVADRHGPGGFGRRLFVSIEEGVRAEGIAIIVPRVLINLALTR